MTWPRARPWRASIALVVAAALLWSVGIAPSSWGSPPRYTFDEHYTAFTAHRIAQGDPFAFDVSPRRYEYLARDRDDLTREARIEWSHPPGAPDAMALSILVFGWSPFAVRLVSLLAALATLLAAMSIAGPRRAPVAVLLLATDGLVFVFARVAMPHMLLTGLLWSATALALRAVRHRRPATLLAGAAALFGLATAVRWSAFPVAALVALALAAPSPAGRRVVTPARLLGCAAAFAGAYLVTYAPMLLGGGSLAELARLHRAMLWFHRHVPADGPQSSPWYAWPFMLRPVVLAMRHGSDAAMIVCRASPLLSWGLVPALAIAVVRAARHRRARDRVMVAVVIGVVAPWALTSRFGLSYYLLPAFPAVALVLAHAAHRLGPRLRPLVVAALAANALVLALLYPVLAGIPLAKGTFDLYARALGLQRAPGAPPR